MPTEKKEDFTPAHSSESSLMSRKQVRAFVTDTDKALQAADAKLEKAIHEVDQKSIQRDTSIRAFVVGRMNAQGRNMEEAFTRLDNSMRETEEATAYLAVELRRYVEYHESRTLAGRWRTFVRWLRGENVASPSMADELPTDGHTKLAATDGPSPLAVVANTDPDPDQEEIPFNAEDPALDHQLESVKPETAPETKP